MPGGKSIEAAAIEGTGLDIGQGLALEGIFSVTVEIADTVPRGPHGDDLAAAVVQRAGNGDDALGDLEEGPHRVSRPKQRLSPFPTTRPTQRQQAA